mgnify:FL=1
MSTYTRSSGRRFYRDADRAVLGGVCAGLANYLGFNLKVTRFLCFIAFLCAFPFALIAYLAIVLLVPASSSRIYDDAMYEERRKDALRKESRRARPTAGEIRERYRSLDERLARIEKYVTSSRYELDEEFRRL